MDFARVGGFHMQAALLATKTASLIGKETLMLFVQPQRLQGTKIKTYITPACLCVFVA
jgi:hypothetical protein